MVKKLQSQKHTGAPKSCLVHLKFSHMYVELRLKLDPQVVSRLGQIVVSPDNDI